MTFSSHGWGYCEVPPTIVWTRIKGSTSIHKGVLLGVFAAPGKMLSGRILLDNGAMVSKIPLSAISAKSAGPAFNENQVQIWDCLSYGISCSVISHVADCEVFVKYKDLKINGKYLFTIIPFGVGTYAEKGTEIGYKDLHVISTIYGLIAYPNSNISWNEKSHVTRFSWDNPPKIEHFDEVPSL